MPILLPSRLPIRGKIYATAEGKHGSYELTLGSERDCDANACFIGFFSGKRHGKLELPERVALVNGIEARFDDVSCGGSCSPASIEWSLNGVLYTVQLNLDEADAKNAERILKASPRTPSPRGPR